MKLEVIDEVPGTGALAQRGDALSIHYRGKLESGAEFDNSYDRAETLDFTLGAGELIKGMDEGLVGMRVGGKRRLRIPPYMGYGSQGVPGLIPPHSVLLFEVELMAIRPPSLG